MFSIPTKPAKPLSIIQAEERNLSQLRNVGVPWVFIQPTRLKKVRIPKIKSRNKNHETFEKLGAEDLAFLGDAGIDITEDEIKKLVKTINRENVIKSEPSSSRLIKDIPNKVQEPTQKFSIPIVKEVRNSVNVIESDGNIDVNDESEQLFSARSKAGNNFVDIFSQDPNKKIEETPSSLNVIHEIETNNIKKMLMDEFVSRARKSQKTNIAKIKLFDTVEGDGNDKMKGAPTPGKKMLNAMVDEITSIGKGISSLEYARISMDAKFQEAKKEIQNCDGALKFKEYLENNNQTVPEILQGLKRKKKRRSQLIQNYS